MAQEGHCLSPPQRAHTAQCRQRARADTAQCLCLLVVSQIAADRDCQPASGNESGSDLDPESSELPHSGGAGTGDYLRDPRQHSVLSYRIRVQRSSRRFLVVTSMNSQSRLRIPARRRLNQRLKPSYQLRLLLRRALAPAAGSTVQPHSSCAGQPHLLTDSVRAQEAGPNTTPATVSTDAWSHVPVPVIWTVSFETCAARNAAVHTCPMFPADGEYS